MKQPPSFASRCQVRSEVRVSTPAQLSLPVEPHLRNSLGTVDNRLPDFRAAIELSFGHAK